jgi:hypothetical protein
MEKHLFRGIDGVRGGILLVLFCLCFIPAASYGDDTEPAVTAGGISGGTRQAATAPIRVRTKKELLAVLAKLRWNMVGPYSSKHPALSPDVRVIGTITLLPGDVPVPDLCGKRDDCRQSVAVDLTRQGVQGVACTRKEKVLWHDVCGEVTFSDTTIRFQGVMTDTHPARWNFIPLLHVLPAASAPCAKGEFRCPADMTCLRSYSEYCRLCLGLAKETCACRGPKGPLPDGSECSYMISGDVIGLGACVKGECVPKR